MNNSDSRFVPLVRNATREALLPLKKLKIICKELLPNWSNSIMGRSRYKIHEEYYPYFITCTFYKKLSLHADPEVAKIILNALQFLQKDRDVKLYAFVLMHDHLHCIVEGNDLSEKLRKFKSFTARSIVDYLIKTDRTFILKQLRLHQKHNSDYRVWQEGFYPKQITTVEMLHQKIEYIHYNPVKAGFVENGIDGRYSSARNYVGLDELIDIDIFEG